MKIYEALKEMIEHGKVIRLKTFIKKENGEFVELRFLRFKGRRLFSKTLSTANFTQSKEMFEFIVDLDSMQSDEWEVVEEGKDETKKD